jgi:hypothetical protein
LPPINPAPARSSWIGRSDQVEASEHLVLALLKTGLSRLQALGAISNRDRAYAAIGCVDIAKAINHDDNEGALWP